MDSYSSQLEDLGSLTCRICLHNYEEQFTNSLQDQVACDEETLKLEDIFLTLMRATKLDISICSLLSKPTRICVMCTDKLLSAFDFISSLERTEEVLHDFLKNKTEEMTTELFEVMKVEVEQLPEEEDISQDVEILEDELEFIEAQENIKTESNSEQVAKSAYESVEDVLEDDNKTEDGADNTITPESKLQSDLSYSGPRKTASNRLRIGSRLGVYDASHRYKCEQCQRAFAKEKTLQKHMDLAHTHVSAEQIAAIAPKPTEEQPLQCAYCPRTFARKYSLRRHVTAMHSDVALDGEQSPSDKKQHIYKRGLCPHCGRSFTQASLIIHIRRHTGEKPYQCDECDKGFPRRQDLVIHKRQHTGERPHVCTVCGKSFSRPNKLSRHMRIHTGQRPYKCTECPKSFSQSNDLRIHMRRHTGEKPYRCNVCSESFISGTALKNHRKIKSHEADEDAATVDRYAYCRLSNLHGKQLVVQE